jgi:DNA-binding protein HU-beta
MTRAALLSLILTFALVVHQGGVQAFTTSTTPPSTNLLRSSDVNIATSTTPRSLKGAIVTDNNNKSSSTSTALHAAAKKDDEEVVNFKKAEFVSAIATKTGLTKSDSEMALSAVLSIITDEVATNKKRISLPGFGTFKLSYRKARKGRNPKTGDEIDIKESYSPSFTASKTFKDLCNPDR